MQLTTVWLNSSVPLWVFESTDTKLFCTYSATKNQRVSKV